MSIPPTGYYSKCKEFALRVTLELPEGTAQEEALRVIFSKCPFKCRIQLVRSCCGITLKLADVTTQEEVKLADGTTQEEALRVITLQASAGFPHKELYKLFLPAPVASK